MIRNVIDIMLGGLDNGRTPNVQQYDVESREYECRLWEAPGVPYSLKKNALVGVVFSWRGNHGSKEYETKIENSSTVVVTVPQEAMLREGIVTMQLKVHEDDGLLHSPEIFFGVLKSIKPGDQESDEPAVMLVALVAQTQALLMEIRNALENGEFDGDDGYSPEINLTRVEGGVRIDVTNQSGTQTEYVYDGTGGTGGSTLPNVTEADEGKVLQVVNGIWAAADGEEITGAQTAVQYGKEQSLTDAQKAQARANIGAISEHDFMEGISKSPPPGYRYQARIRIGERNVLSVELPDALWEQDDYKFAPAVKVTSAGNAITDAAGGQAASVVVSLSPKLEDGSLAPNPSGGRFAPWTDVMLSENGVASLAPVPGSPYAGTVDFVSGTTEAAGVRLYNASDLFVLHPSTAPGTSSAGVKYLRVALKQDVESLDFMNLFVACNRYERRTASPYNNKTIRVNSNAPYIYDNDIDFNNPLAILDGLQFLLRNGNAETFYDAGWPVLLNQGSNTITSDAGAVTVTYGVDTKTYIDQKFAALSAALLGG